MGKNRNRKGGAAAQQQQPQRKPGRVKVPQVTSLGRVVRVVSDQKYGFLKPKDGREDGRDIFFHFDRVVSGALSPIAGDIIEFSLSNKQSDKGPSVFRGTLSEGKTRKDDQLDGFFNEVTCTFLSANEEQGASNDEKLKILSCTAAWKCVVNSIKSQENVKRFMETFTIVSENLKSLKSHFTNVIDIIADSKLIHMKEGALASHIQIYARESFSVLRKFLLAVAAAAPEKARNVVRLIQPIAENPNIACSLFYDLLETTTRCVSSSVDALYWNELPLVPTTEEIEEVKEKEPNESLQLQPIKEQGAYTSPSEYFEILFRLLRADCFQSLKEGINKFLNNALDRRDLNVYFDVTIVGIHVSVRSKICLAVRLRTQEKKINWNSTTKLMFGNLLCISMNGQFNDAIWTTVASREHLQSHQIVLLEMCSELNSTADIDSIQILTSSKSRGMAAESPTYYRAYGPILKALQKQDPETVSFKSELVDVIQTGKPEFLTGSSTFKADVIISGPVPNDNLFVNEIPHQNTIFDESQKRAVIECLQQKIGIIQGPPGTGKTFIGVKLVQLLLSLSTKPSGPILVLTYKNHALDEFLKALISVGIEDVVRVGGGSKEGAISEYNLNNLERKVQKSNALFQQIEMNRDELLAAEGEVKEAFSKLKAAEKFSMDGFLSYVNGKQLHDFLNTFQREALWKNPTVGVALNNLSFEDLKYEAEKDASVRKLIAQALEVWLPSRADILSFEKQLASSLNWISHEAVFEEGDDNEDGINSDDEKDVEDMLTSRRSAIGDGSMQFHFRDVLTFGQDESKDGAIRLFEFAAEFLGTFPTQIFSNINNLWKVKKHDKLKLLQFIIYKHHQAAAAEFNEKLRKFEKLCNVQIELRNQHRASVLKTKSVVAMTITGASINHGLLQEIEPSIIIVEEAAELLEAQLVPALGSWAKQLILIGDHKQLRPSVETYFLERDFNMSLSLMERLINNGFQYSTLSKQNRMRPEFADLLLDIYPNLESNLDRVANNEPARCLQSSAFFWHHESKETSERSAWNDEEAERAVNLAIYMIEQGIQPCKITILSAYKGQNGLIRKKLKAEESQGRLKDIQDENNKIITQTIDNYQGDENDFVIISLVRSNEKKKIGFLKILNRRCVAQSRSRCGLYFIGNSLMFSGTESWAVMLVKMKNSGIVASTITLVCQKHPKSLKHVSSAKELNSKWLCRVECATNQLCGHACKKPCQPFHEHDECPEACTSQCEKCHSPCKKMCMPFHNHDGCDTIIDLQLPCLHTVQAPCITSHVVVCVEDVDFIAKKCGHALTRKCSKSEDDVKCIKPCQKTFDPCGHFCKRKCWAKCSQECYECKRLEHLEQKKREKEQLKLRKVCEEEEKKKIAELLKNTKLEPIREELSKDGDTADEYLTIEDQVKKYIQPGHKWYPVVTKIEKVVNCKLEIEWRKAKIKMFDPGMRIERKFHGTSKDAIDRIIKDGFLMPKSPGMFGTGIYFATDSSKSAQEIYTKGSNTLLLCDVLLGKTKTVETAMPKMTAEKLKSEKYDSLFAKRNTKSGGGVLFDEYVVYDPNHALPRYIISYRKHNALTPIALPGSLAPSTKMTKHLLKATRSVDVSNPFDMHYRLAESQFLRLMNETKSNRKIKSITYYSNPMLEKKFNDKADAFKKAGRSDECIFGFHGTAATSVDEIMKNNFRIDLISQNTGNPGQYGSGIYFSEVPKVCFHYGESLLLCKVLLGTCCDVTAMTDVKGKQLISGYDSHGAYPTSDGNFKIIVIGEKDQILPCYLIENEPMV